MKLIKEGKIQLDDTIDKYLKVKIPSKKGIKITFRHLVTHTSGLPSIPTNFNPSDCNDPYNDYKKQQMYEFLDTCELLSIPGEKYEYSNLGMALLGHILSTIEKKSFEELIKTEILMPLDMKNTYVFFNDIPQNKLVIGHYDNKEVKNWNFSIFSPAGSICSNIEDMILFLAANMGMTNSYLYDWIKSCHCLLHELNEEYVLGIGFGWHINKANDGTIIWHNGGTGGYSSFLGFNSKTQKGVVILSNTSSDVPTELGFHIIDSDFYKLNK